MDQIRQAKQPVSRLAGPYGHPIHPLLVPVPIGAWVCSIVFDLASRLTGVAGGSPDEGTAWLGEASRWLIALGVVGALAAASAGFFDLLAIPAGVRAFRVALVHMTLNLLVVLAYGVNFGLRTDTSATGVPFGLIVFSGISLAVLGASGYLGGMLAYRYGVRVADEQTQAEGFTRRKGGFR